MNWRFIVNTVIILLILHFILENLNLNISINSPEFFHNSSIRQSNNILSPQESLQFLTQDKVEGFTTDDLINYIQNKNVDIRGKNFYTTDYNTPQFNSNLTDVQSFYNINNTATLPNFDGINLNNIDRPKNSNRLDADQWKYKNEFPMNGGSMDGVVGYNRIEDDYAPINTNNISNSEDATFLNSNRYQSCTGKTDDLRFQRENYNV
jgi:hypothetical protein